MNRVTKWYSHKLYQWMDESSFTSMETKLKKYCREDVVASVLQQFNNITLESIEFYEAGSYEEPEKIRLDNIPAFYLIRMKHQITKNHVGTMRVYLPVHWNHRFMGTAGAGTNTEVDWFTAVTFNVISWPMALKNGYACTAADNDTGIRLDCTWGFDSNGNLEWDHIDAWVHKTLHEMTVCAKALIGAIYQEDIIASYFHGTSGGGRQAITEAIRYPEDYDGLWADGPAINYLDLQFACLWAAIVEANEKHVVPLSKYKKAFELAVTTKSVKGLPFNSRDTVWMDFMNQLYGIPTEDGPITGKDLNIMVKTWDGPFTSDGKRMAYGFGPAIRQWPEETVHEFYGYFNRREDGRLKLMPIAEQSLRWFTHNPNFDVYSCSYEEYEKIYKECRKEFGRYDFKDTDFEAYASRGGKLMITHGTGDCVVPYQAAIDYYQTALDHFPSEKIMNQSVRMFMPPMAGHSILDWSGGATACSVGMKILTDWVEKNQAPDTLPTVRYDFLKDKPLEEDVIEAFNQWHYKKKLQKRQR